MSGSRLTPEVRFFRLSALGLTAAAAVAMQGTLLALEIAKVKCQGQLVEWPLPAFSIVDVLFGLPFVLAALAQWKFYRVGITMTGVRISFLLASIFYLWFFHWAYSIAPGFHPITLRCYGQDWHDHLSFQAMFVIALLIFEIVIVAPLSLILTAWGNWR